MPELKLCVREDLADWWSSEGLTSREDDDRDAVSDDTESDRTDRFIVRGSSRVAAYLAQRYKPSEYQGTNPPIGTPPIVRHWAAVVAAYYLGIRRNLPISAELKGEYERTLVELAQIRDGSLSIPEVAESFETIPTVTNFHVDGTFRSNKARVVVASSTGKRPTPPIKDNQENRGNYGFFE